MRAFGRTLAATNTAGRIAAVDPFALATAADKSEHQNKYQQNSHSSSFLVLRNSKTGELTAYRLHNNFTANFNVCNRNFKIYRDFTATKKGRL